MRPRRALATLLCLPVLLVACGGLQKGSGSGSSPTDPPGIAHPTGADQLVVRIDVGGGFVNPSYSVRQIPTFSLLGDGTVIYSGPQTEMYPGPALVNVLQRHIDEDAVQRILEAAREAGLFGPDRNYTDATHMISDAATTTFTVVVEGQAHTVSVYALGDGYQPTGISSDEAEARTKLGKFMGQATGLDTWLPKGSLGEERPFEPQGLRVFVADGAPQAGGDVTEPSKDWPLAQSLATFGTSDGSGLMRCGTVTGSDLGQVLPAVRDATEITPWQSDGKAYTLLFRVLLPDESGCAGLS